jgi:hypothetical protein
MRAMRARDIHVIHVILGRPSSATSAADAQKGQAACEGSHRPREAAHFRTCTCRTHADPLDGRRDGEVRNRKVHSRTNSVNSTTTARSRRPRWSKRRLAPASHPHDAAGNRPSAPHLRHWPPAPVQPVAVTLQSPLSAIDVPPLTVLDGSIPRMPMRR